MFKVILGKIIGPHTHKEEELEKFKESELLIKFLGGEVILKFVQHRLLPDGATYFGLGKINELKKFFFERKVDGLVLDDIVLPTQIFRLEKNFWEINPQIYVWDRIDLILKIFDKRASSSEAKLQIELAKLKHLGPRIYGLGKMFSQQAGGIGTRGLGETNTELMRRYIKDRINKIEIKLKKIVFERKKRIQERKNKGIRTIALVGYTNAGKTSLFNLLTGKDKKTEDAPFTTLDSYVGKLNHKLNLPVLISDTIGFIENLPPNLIEAFKSTLMETVYADLIFHIIDISDRYLEKKSQEVDKILEELKIEKERIIKIFNKIDLLNSKNKFIFNELNKKFFISCKTKKGIEKLLEFIYQKCHFF